MRHWRHLLITLAGIILLFLIFSQTVYATIDVGTFDEAAHAYYIGPGTLTIISQVLIGLVIGGAAMTGIYRVRVKNFLTNVFARRRHKEEGGETEETEKSE